MNLGKTIQLPGIRGAHDLDCAIPDSGKTRRVKVYQVPAAVSDDQYYVSITEQGATEDIPPCLGRDTLLLADYSLSGDGESTINYIHEEVNNNA